MNLTACGTCALWFSYILLWVSAIILSCVGVKAVNLFNAYDKVSEIAQIRASGRCILVAGILIFVAAALGTTAYCCKNRCLLIVFCVFLLIIWFFELGAVILSFSHWATLGSNLKMVLGMELSSYGKDDHITSDVDNIQKTLECCGISSYIDWNATDFFRETQTYPSSCYSHSTHGVSRDGCYPLLQEKFHCSFMAIIVSGIACILSQVFGLYSVCVESKLSAMAAKLYWDGHGFRAM